MNIHVPSLQRSLSDIVAEYDTKLASIDDAVRAFHRAGADLKMAATVGGEFGDVSIDTGHVRVTFGLQSTVWEEDHV